MRKVYDVAIAGLGAMGSAAAWQLTRRGMRVLGLDRFAPPHVRGSAHGKSRVTREAYFEHPLYVPLVRRAHELWRELERESGRQLLRITRGLMIGPPGGLLVSGALASAQAHEIPVEQLTAAEVRRRFPVLTPSNDMVGVLEPNAGMLFPELCIESCLQLAQQRGAELRADEPVTAWHAQSDAVRITTTRGSYSAGKLILAAGAWLPMLLQELELPLTIERQFMTWFRPRNAPDRFNAEHLPIALWEYPPDHYLATLPDVGHGVKLAIHHDGSAVDPDTMDRAATQEEVLRARTLLETLIPDAAGELLDAQACLYTNTPDSHFVIDFHPADARVIIASACSGHGFKFASAIGEIVSDLATTGNSTFELAPFRVARFQ